MAASPDVPDPDHREVDAAAWDGLLAFLGRDGDRGAAYEAVRRRLQLFFEWKGCPAAAELADETLNRVATKLAGGEVIRTEEPLRYVLGVARFVYLEAHKRMARHQPDDGATRAAVDDRSEQVDRETRLAALEACLDGLPPANRALLLRYHEDDGRQRIDHRKRLADEWKIPLNALRIRAHRLRAQIEECVQSRLEPRNGNAAPTTAPGRRA